MTRFNTDDGTLGACADVNQIVDWLTNNASYVDFRAGTVSLDHIRAALRHAHELGRRAASTEAPGV